MKENKHKSMEEKHKLEYQWISCAAKNTVWNYSVL